MANLAVFGLGYVGSVTAACFASRGHQVIGVDTNHQKLDLLRQGIPPVAEPGLPELVQSAVRNRRLCVTHDVNEAIRRSDLSFISVGTPPRRNGDVDLSALECVLEQIGVALRDHDKFHTIVLRSTIPPALPDALRFRFWKRCPAERQVRDLKSISTLNSCAKVAPFATSMRRPTL